MIRYLTAGESHGPELDVIIDGFPANFQLDLQRINSDLASRQVQIGSGARQSIETDRVVVNAGMMEGQTTGSPLSFAVVNRDHKNWQGRSVDAMTIPRPGHADLGGVFKYDLDDIRKVLERSSARETAMRVVAGSCCMQVLEQMEIYIKTAIESVGSDDGKKPEDKVLDAAKHGETVGGTLKTIVSGLIPGVGSYVQHDRKLDAKIAAAVISVQAIKGIEFGSGFSLAGMLGTEAQRHLGGFAGGMTDGRDIVIRSVMKPIPTTLNPQDSFSLVTGEQCKTKYERSDIAPIFRTPIIIDSVVAIEILNALIEQFGGDTFEDLAARYNSKKKQWKAVSSEKKQYCVTDEKKVFWSK